MQELLAEIAELRATLKEKYKELDKLYPQSWEKKKELFELAEMMKDYDSWSGTKKEMMEMHLRGKLAKKREKKLQKDILDRIKKSREE